MLSLEALLKYLPSPTEEDVRTAARNVPGGFDGLPDLETIELCMRLGDVAILMTDSDDPLMNEDPEYPYLWVQPPSEMWNASIESGRDKLLEVGLTPGTSTLAIAWLGADPSEGYICYWVTDDGPAYALDYERDLHPLPFSSTAAVFQAALTGEGSFRDYWQRSGCPTSYVIGPRGEEE